MKYVLFYQSTPETRAKARENFPAHRKRVDEFHARGDMLMVGLFTNEDAAMSVFRTREAAEEFAADDPFVVNGVVSEWRISEWNEILAD